jgi:Ca2+-binding EF-hand superfamily protein
MQRKTKIGLAALAAALAGAVAVAGTSYAGRGFGGHGGAMMMMGPAMELIRQIDTNSDMALSQGEIDAATNGRFDQFDADRNGQLSLDEFQGLWADITRPVAVRAFQFLDPNGDATVAKEEISQRFGSVVQHFDRNGDGALSRDDHRHGHGRMERGDGNGDGGAQQ